MVQSILIGLYIGSGSASAAIRLSGQERSEVVTWSRDKTQRTVPLHISQSSGDIASFQWGYGVEPTDAIKLFGLIPWLSGEYDPEGYALADCLYQKRGMKFYGQIGLEDSEPTYTNKAPFEAFARSLITYILNELPNIYSHEASSGMEKRVCITIPPYVGENCVREFEHLIRQALDGLCNDCIFIPQPQASLLCLEKATRPAPDMDGCILACHMEEEVTTISLLTTSSDTPPIEMTYFKYSIVTLGAFDIADRFQKYVEDNALERSRTEKDPAERIVNELSKLRTKFLDRLHNLSLEGPEIFRNLPRSLGSRLTISDEEMKKRIFNPVLGLIVSEMESHLTAWSYFSKKIQILLSGVLAECPYVHHYINNSFANRAEIIHTTDEAISPSQGAIAQLEPQKVWIKVTDVPLRERGTTTRLDCRLDWLTKRENSLTDFYLSSKVLKDQVISGLVHQFEIALCERIMRQGITDKQTKATCVILIRWLGHLKRYDERITLSRKFADEYSKDVKAILGRNDPRSRLKNLHLAAACDDDAALDVIMAGDFSLRELAPCMAPLLEYFAPLELCSWYCNPDGGVKCAKLLLGTVCPGLVRSAHIAARRGCTKLLQLFRTQAPIDFKAISGSLVCLAELGPHEETVEWLHKVEPIASWDPPSEIIDPLTGEWQSQYPLRSQSTSQNGNRKSSSSIVREAIHGSLGKQPLTIPEDSCVEDTWAAKLIGAASKTPHELRGHSKRVTALALSPDGGLIASGSNDNTVKLWDTKTKEHRTLKGHSKGVSAVAFSSDGQLVASASWDATLRLWDARTGEVHHIFRDGGGAVAFSHNGQFLASGIYGGTFNVWNTRTRLLHHEFKCDPAWFSNYAPTVTFSPDSKLIAAATGDKSILLWDTTTGEVCRILRHSKSVNSLAFSPNGRLLAAGSSGRTIRLWDITTGTIKHSLKGGYEHNCAVAFSPSGQLLAQASQYGNIRFWDVASGLLSRKIVLDAYHSPLCIAFSSQGQIVSCESSRDKIVKLWGT